uniref:Uncharacterized protein n=1 Tax=Steinernema glaseri TaxID=37863 RepID=A0A1I7ZA17_9BILA
MSKHTKFELLSTQVSVLAKITRNHPSKIAKTNVFGVLNCYQNSAWKLRMSWIIWPYRHLKNDMESAQLYNPWTSEVVSRSKAQNMASRNVLNRTWLHVGSGPSEEPAKSA